MKKSVLITGSTGFIGRNLVEQFSNNYSLLTPSHKELDLTNSEIVRDYFKDTKVDIIIHCASSGSGGFKGGDWKEKDAQPLVIKQNLQMFFNIVNNLNSNQRLINLGSGAEYDKRFEIKKVKETDAGKSIPPEDYAFSKYLMSRYISNSNEDLVHLRLFSVFGKYEDYKLRFISKSICRNLANKPINIYQDVFFDYLYIDDLVKIIDYFIQNKPSEKIYNVGTGTQVNLLSIAEKVISIADRKSDIIIQNQGLNREYTCDNSRLVTELKNFHFTPIEESIREVYNYYKDTFNRINAEFL